MTIPGYDRWKLADPPELGEEPVPYEPEPKPEKSRMQDLLEAGEFRCRAYSGRGMYGKECLMAEVDDFGRLIAAVLEHVEGEESTADLQEAFGNMVVDSLGLSHAVYFPGIEYVPADDHD